MQIQELLNKTCEELPDGYEIVISISDGLDIQLIDEFGEQVTTGPVDTEESCEDCIRRMIVEAKQQCAADMEDW